MDTQNKRRACPRGSQFCLLSLSYKKNLRLLENIFKSLEEKLKKEGEITVDRLTVQKITTDFMEEVASEINLEGTAAAAAKSLQSCPTL